MGELELECDIAELPAVAAPKPRDGVTIGTLIGFKDHGNTPLILYGGQPGTAALTAVSTVALDGTHIGRNVVMSFENGEPDRPVILGLVRTEMGRALRAEPGQVSVDADGERLLISAQRELVLRCGNASITLTKNGKVLITGTYVSQRSTGTMRIKGGSVQIN
jgi:uncharacterized protein (DUF2345 family)